MVVQMRIVTYYCPECKETIEIIKKDNTARCPKCKTSYLEYKGYRWE